MDILTFSDTSQSEGRQSLPTASDCLSDRYYFSLLFKGPGTRDWNAWSESDMVG